jgi:hypothetical protein
VGSRPHLNAMKEGLPRARLAPVTPTPRREA